MTPACPYLAAVWKGVSPYCNTEDNSTVSRWVRTHVILHVRPAAVEKENPTGLIVATLTAQVESCEAAPVLHVHVGLGPAQRAHSPAEPLPGGLVQRRVAVQLVLVGIIIIIIIPIIIIIIPGGRGWRPGPEVTSRYSSDLRRPLSAAQCGQSESYKLAAHLIQTPLQLTKSWTLASHPRSRSASTVSR